MMQQQLDTTLIGGGEAISDSCKFYWPVWFLTRNTIIPVFQARFVAMSLSPMHATSALF